MPRNPSAPAAVRRAPMFFVSLVAVLASGCGGGSSPTAPAAATPTATSITVTLARDTIRVGQTTQATATATMSNGSTQNVASGWQSDAPSVATVSASGTVTGVNAGRATIFVISDGRQGQQVVRVIPDFQGTWSGSYTVESCTDTGTIATAGRFCAELFTPNRVLPTNLNLIQSDDRVSGQFFLGTIAGEGSGPIDGESNLIYTGQARSGEITIDTIWRLRSDNAGRITGTLTQTLRAASTTGDVRVTATIRDLNRTSASATEAMPVPHGDARLGSLASAIATRR